MVGLGREELVSQRVRNVLYIMCDQLRFDYLSCAGHKILSTPHVDGLAARGVRFDRAYVQGAVCGPSRMSSYTGRYVGSHHAIWNFVPLRVGEMTIGDYLRPHGIRVAVAGKTHMEADRVGMRRLGIAPHSELGTLLAEGGFEPFDRDDGLYPSLMGKRIATQYCEYLRARGYEADNPWHDWANAALAADGTLLSGWSMRHARHPARVREMDSETPYMTQRAMRFIAEQGDAPWCLHLSFIKPHWPYVAPAPYNDMYADSDILPTNRSAAELEDQHPVYAAYGKVAESESFAREEVRRTVIPTYMGLIKQIDDQMGVLFAFLQQQGRMTDTLIVFTSDHGDYLGDHWLGEKELFHDASARVPMIVYDPDPAADATRGTVDRHLVEAIDLLPTFLHALGITPVDHILEGRSLLPLLRDAAPADWRDAVFCELDYSFREPRLFLGLPVEACRAMMVRDERWKLLHFDGFRPMLFDLENDPQELVDLGADPAREAVRRELTDRLFVWLSRLQTRETTPRAAAEGWVEKANKGGILIGQW
jgi:arylsulfatase A-like enzyme